MEFAVSAIVVVALVAVIFLLRVGVARSLILCRPTLFGESRVAARERRLTKQQNSAEAGLFAVE